MENSERGNRDILLQFRVTGEEYEIIKKKYESSDCKNMSAYLRKMAALGFVLKFNEERQNNIYKLMSNIANNINQIAFRVNSSGNIYEEDLAEIKEELRDLWQQQKSIQSVLLSIKV